MKNLIPFILLFLLVSCASAPNGEYVHLNYDSSPKEVAEYHNANVEDMKYYNSMKKINRYLMKCQIIQTGNKDLLGGISGSYPIQGNYGKFEILNWATKFYIDALLLENLIQKDKDHRYE